MNALFIQYIIQELSDLQAVVETVFQSIFVHRYKDSGEQVRRVCAGHLGTWITLDPVHNVKDEYLKYIGWLCSDKASSVRLEAVRCIDKLLNVSAFLPFFPFFFICVRCLIF